MEKSIILWLNSQFYSSSQFVNLKFYELSFNIPQITLFNTTKLKVVSYIHQSTSSKQLIIRLKNLLFDGLCSYPQNYPILYVANTNVDSQLENNEYSLSLLPQTINNLTLVLDEQFLTSFNGITGDLVQQAITLENYSDVVRNGVVVNPLAWYKFDKSTNLGLEVSGNYNLTNNNVTYNSTFLTSGTGSGSFNGNTNTYLGINSGFIDLDAKDFSISFWAYNTLTTQTNNRYFYQIGNSLYTGFNAFIAMYRSSTGTLVAYTGSEVLQFITGTYHLNTWIHLTYTYQQSNRQAILYLNGVNVASRTNTKDYKTDKYIRIGAVNTGVLNYQGYIDDFRIYDVVLTQSEITNLYNKITDIYIPPKFILGLSIEDAEMEVYDSVSAYRLRSPEVK